MSDVRLRGQLVCQNPDEARIVVKHLPKHVALTRDEPGCIVFEVTQTANPLIWNVEEHFKDEAVFMAHQDRVTDSEWGRMTAGIERRYTVEGLAR